MASAASHHPPADPPPPPPPPPPPVSPSPTVLPTLSRAEWMALRAALTVPSSQPPRITLVKFSLDVMRGGGAAVGVSQGDLLSLWVPPRQWYQPPPPSSSSSSSSSSPSSPSSPPSKDRQLQVQDSLQQQKKKTVDSLYSYSVFHPSFTPSTPVKVDPLARMERYALVSPSSFLPLTS